MKTGVIFATPLGGDSPPSLGSYSPDRCRWDGCREEGRRGYHGYCLRHYTQACRLGPVGLRPAAASSSAATVPRLRIPLHSPRREAPAAPSSPTKEYAMPIPKGITDDKIREACESSATAAEAAKKLGCTGGTVLFRCRRLGITKFQAQRQKTTPKPEKATQAASQPQNGQPAASATTAPNTIPEERFREVVEAADSPAAAATVLGIRPVDVRQRCYRLKIDKFRAGGRRRKHRSRKAKRAAVPGVPAQTKSRVPATIPQAADQVATVAAERRATDSLCAELLKLTPAARMRAHLFITGFIAGANSVELRQPAAA